MNQTLCLLSFLLFSAGSAQAQAPFFQGKTITIVVGYLAGDGYDIWTRLLAAHMGKHIPGSPNMIAQNMPGAGSNDTPRDTRMRLVGSAQMRYDWCHLKKAGGS